MCLDHLHVDYGHSDRFINSLIEWQKQKQEQPEIIDLSKVIIGNEEIPF